MVLQWGKVMGQRELKDTVEQQYFEPVAVPVSEDEGTRDMKVLYPFLISGGANTERWYFVHINDLTEFKFNINRNIFQTNLITQRYFLKE